MPEKRYSSEEIHRRGDEWYEKVVRREVEEGNIGRIVAIDIESGDYELDDDTYCATKRLLARKPDAQIWQIRIGYPAVIHFGGSFAPRPS